MRIEHIPVFQKCFHAFIEALERSGHQQEGISLYFRFNSPEEITFESKVLASWIGRLRF